MLRLEVAAIYVGVNILLLLILSYLVVSGRRSHKISFGDAGNERFARAVRAHGNAAEYIPAGLVGIVLIALMEPATPLWLLHASGLSLTLGRIFHAIGLHTSPINAGRAAGMVLTWAAYLLIGGGLLYAGLAQQL